jgi:hypothetical protein
MENDRSDEKAKENADEGFGHSLISATAEFPIRSLEDAFGGKGYRAVNRGRREPNMPIISSGRRPMQIKLPSRLGLSGDHTKLFTRRSPAHVAANETPRGSW